MDSSLLENIFRAVMVSVGGTVTGLIIKAIRKIYKKVIDNQNEQTERTEILCVAMRNILRTQIVCMYEDSLDKGYITNLKLHSMEQMYSSYKALNGNTFVDDIMIKVRKLEVKAMLIKEM